MPTRNINLTSHYDELLGKLVDSGRFKNVSEAVRAGLFLLEREAQTFDAKLEALRNEAAIGEQAYERGEYTALEDDDALNAFFEEIDSSRATA